MDKGKDAGKKARILIVDNEPGQATLLESYLLSRDYDVFIASNGEEAPKIINDNNIDLVLLKVRMPGINGFEITKRIKADGKTQFTPVVLIMGPEEDRDRIESTEAGCDDFIGKRFDKNELLIKIKSLLRTKSLYDGAETKYKQLKESERIRKRLTTIITHDLNNPLTAISGGIQLVKMGGEEKFTENQKKNLEIALLAVKDLKDMIGNLLDVDKMEEGTLRPNCESFRLDGLARELADEMSIIAHYDEIIISLEIAEDMPSVSADKELIRRVIANLINNALNFTPPKSTVTVEVFYKKESNSFYVQVKDAGRGIPEERLGGVFNKFIQAETEEKVKINRGLGLTFCRMIVELHGGRIWAANNPDKGSMFTFTLARNEN